MTKVGFSAIGGFFQSVRFVFQISKKIYTNFPAITVNNKFKLQAQDSNLEYFDLEIFLNKSYL